MGDLIYGDTNSTLAGALAASKLHVPVAHVEAGLRSYNRKMPEEINRILTDHISDILFVPTDGAAENLKNEGISGNSIHQVGDVMYDAAMHFTQKAENQSSIMQKLDIKNDDYILATIHRPENTDNPEKLNNIVSALSHAPIPVILPLHPRTKRKCKDYNISIDGQIKQIDPVGFLDMLVLEKSAKAIATDSGGIQKEAFFFNVPCITMREETEWIELVDANVNILVGGEYAKILDSLYNFRPDDFNFSFFGSGNSAVKIVDQFTRL